MVWLPWRIGRRRSWLARMAVLTAATSEVGYTASTSSWWAPDEDAEETPELRWPRNIEVFDRMRRQDAQVKSVLRAVTQPILRTTWRIDPNDAPDEVAQFVAANLGLPVKGEEPKPLPRQRDRFQWLEHLSLALTMLPFGHSVFEQVYRIEGGRAWLRKLGWRPPRTISKVDVAPDGGLVAIEQYSSDGKGHRIPVERLVVYVHEREGGNWLGTSLLRAAYKFWLLKDRLLRVQVQTVDRNGMGVPVYTASPIAENTDPADALKRAQDELEAGLAIARGLRSGDSAGAAIPNAAELKLLGVEGTLPDANPPIRYYDEQIARAVLAHFLNLGTETGSWALGSTFANFFVESLQGLAQQIADTTTAHVIEDLVDINFGPDTPAPRLVFDEIGSQQQVTAEAIKALIDCKALHPDPALELYLRQTFGLPPVLADGDDSTSSTDDAEQARFAAETVQKAYLGVGTVLTIDEARDLARRSGAVLGKTPPGGPAQAKEEP